MIQFAGLKRKFTIYTLRISENINFIIYGKFFIYIYFSESTSWKKPMSQILAVKVIRFLKREFDLAAECDLAEMSFTKFPPDTNETRRTV